MSYKIVYLTSQIQKQKLSLTILHQSPPLRRGKFWQVVEMEEIPAVKRPPAGEVALRAAPLQYGLGARREEQVDLLLGGSAPEGCGGQIMSH